MSKASPKQCALQQLVGPGKSTPGLNSSTMPLKLAAKARWAELKSTVKKDIDTEAKVGNIKVKYRVTDVWQQILDNDKDDDIVGATKFKNPGIKIIIRMYDTNFPPSKSKYATKWTRSPRKIFEHCIGDGKQDFRWLSMLATKRYAASYKPNGRLRQREYAIGSRSENMPQKVYLDKIRTAMGFGDSSLANVKETTLLCEALKDGDNVYVHFRKGVPLGLFVGREDSKVQVLISNGGLNVNPSRGKEKFKQYRAFLSEQRNKKVGQHFVNLGPLKQKKYVFKDAEVEDAPEASPVPDLAINEDDKPLDLPSSVFSERASMADSRGFFDTDEFYGRVCEADFHYCPRIRRMVEDSPGDYEKIQDIIGEHYRYVREAFRFHVAESASDSFEMSWMDFTSFAKYCKIVDPHEEEAGGFGFKDLDAIWVLVNCHEHNEAVKSHHIRYLSRFEFLEALVRIAVAKYGKNDSGHDRLVSSAVDTLITANIQQYYKTMDANTFRRQKLYSTKANKIFSEHEKSIRLLFRTYALFQSRKDKFTRKHTIKTGGIAFADDPNCLTKIQFIELLQSGGAFEGGKRLKKDACRVFIYSQNTTLDEFQRSKEAALRDDSKTLCYPEFLESLARLAEIDHRKENAKKDFWEKLRLFLVELTSKLNL